MMKTFCLDGQKDWDDGIFMLLFAVREVFQESLGFSPFELALDTLWEVLFDRKMAVKILLFVFQIMWSILGIRLQEHVHRTGQFETKPS
jgi:uncharacterized membrane protein YczE